MFKKVVAFLLSFLLSVPLFAQEQVFDNQEGKKTVTTQDISVSRLGRLYIERTKIDGMMASFDKIIRERSGRDLVLFDSEGCFIENVYEYDFDKDGIPELLIQMDLGGSGGLREFRLLQYKDGAYEQIWEISGFAGGKAIIKNYINKTRVFIRYIDENEKAPKNKIDVFEMHDGKMIKISGGTAG